MLSNNNEKVILLYKVCKSEEIKDNSLMVFNIHDKAILIGTRNGMLFACDNSCPHRGASLSKGHFNNNHIVCYMHGYEFDLFTGKLVNMKSWKKEDHWVEQVPEWRKSGDLTLYRIFESNGDVTIEIPD
jgi:nitrite reductase/ring-hydroxylating ferredoxin subunit